MSIFTMSQHPYAYEATPPSRHYPGHGTSSAFSSSANPDEDWTKISDLAERRRIQNRIAQRNYRKKLKRRLEDLERKAASPEEIESEKTVPPSSTKSGLVNDRKANVTRRKTTTKPSKVDDAPTELPASGQFTPPMDSSDELLFTPAFDQRQRSSTPPSYPSYQPFSSSEDLLLNPYQQTQPCAAVTSFDSYPNYMANCALPAMLPPMMHFNDASKKDDSQQPYDDLTSYLYYGFGSGMDSVGNTAYDHPNAHTPPLSYTFDHSANCSDAGLEYPTTPLSLPPSPNAMY